MIRTFWGLALCWGCLCAAPAADVAAVGAADTEPMVEEPKPLTDGDGVVACYDMAVAQLELICDDYRRIKAIQLSRQRDIAFEDAYENISSVMPNLKPINRELLIKKIYNPDDIVPHKHEVEKIEGEVQMMVELAAKLLEEIEKVQQEMAQQQQEEMQKLTLEDIVQKEQFDPEQMQEMEQQKQEQQSEQMQQLQKLAKENPEEQAKDLTAQMKQIQPLPDIQDLTKKEQMRAEQLKLELMRSKADAGKIMGKLDLKQVSRINGRRIQIGDGEGVEWMFVDTWYTIGPFPNPSRINIHRKFPPETVVDLGAEYDVRGKSGEIRKVKWTFLQMGEPQCRPNDDEEYAIYYAYTELWFDQPMDLWIAVGSDDKANVWINDMPVWISGDQLKGWKVDEGFRKVSFQPGVNRVLYRVENGWKGTAFSLGIRVMAD